MTDNGAMSFTESAEVPKEPIKLTEEKRIEKEAIAFATVILGEPPMMMDDTIVIGYIAGANAERERYNKLWNEYQLLYGNYANHDRKINELQQQLKDERNKAIDECINKLNYEYVERGDINAPWQKYTTRY